MTRVLADYVRAGLKVRSIAEMGRRRFKVALTDGETIFLSPAQRRLFDDETGEARRHFLLSCPVVTISGRIEDALRALDREGKEV